jgi:isopentenyldiphosphate isomerase
MTALREFAEQHKVTNELFDSSGKKLCDVDINPINGHIMEIRTVPYENVAAVADNADEIIYCTNRKGVITPERISRSEAQEQGKRYLVVTTLLFHKGQLLLQKRSADKRLDPEKLSASAHGVAKEVRGVRGGRVTHTEYAALINSALEINEELRHGKDQTPFIVRVWDGSEAELIAYAEHMKWNDPNVLHLVPSLIAPRAGYPMDAKENKRTRTICNGFVFSEEAPNISVDPHEAEGYEWARMSRIGDRPDTTADVQQSIDGMVNTTIGRSLKGDPVPLAQAMLRNLFK